MHFSRRFGSPVAAVAVLIGIAVLVVITVGEGLKVFVGKQGHADLNKRDDSIPWFSWSSDNSLQQRDTSSAFLAERMGAISDVAGTLFDGGVTQAKNVVGGGKKAASPQIKEDVSPSVEGNIASSAVAGVDNAVKTASQEVDQIVNAATGIAGSILASASGVSNLAPLAEVLATSTGNVAASRPSISLANYLEAAPPPAPTSNGTPKPSVVNTTPMAPLAGNGNSTSPSSVKNMTSIPNLMSNNNASVPSGVAMPSNKPSLQNITSPAMNNTSGDLKGNSSALSGTAMPTNNIRPPPPQNMTKPQNITSESPLKPSMLPLSQNTTAPRPANTSCPAPMMMTMTMTTTMQPECPAPVTETCTVTETWHSTIYAGTVTLFSFMDVFTVTCTTTVSDCSDTPSMPTPHASPHNSTNSTNSHSVGHVPVYYSFAPSAKILPAGALQTVMASSTVKHTSGSVASAAKATGTSGSGKVTCSDGTIVSDVKDCLDGVADAGSSVLANRAIRLLSKDTISGVSAVTVIHQTSAIHTIRPLVDESKIFSIMARHGGSRKKRDLSQE
ncbi:hypothetical protein HYALB_00003863 [Hymenoscyphus albidus]|uniref:Uncharacterized protein n=1 Tax=Hymenoscyphus albidus TaxID=595503 RepID=A0A9N9LY87_9HELO|nr:hypothetical protein HYALB_00003863 [Hymenoscyphus albidus]